MSATEKKRRLPPGSTWRFAAGGAQRGGARVELSSACVSAGLVFDELAVPGVLHVEQVSARQWIIEVGETTLTVTVGRDGVARVRLQEGELDG